MSRRCLTTWLTTHRGSSLNPCTSLSEWHRINKSPLHSTKGETTDLWFQQPVVPGNLYSFVPILEQPDLPSVALTDSLRWKLADTKQQLAPKKLQKAENGNQELKNDYLFPSRADGRTVWCINCCSVTRELCVDYTSMFSSPAVGTVGMMTLQPIQPGEAILMLTWCNQWIFHYHS